MQDTKGWWGSGGCVAIGGRVDMAAVRRFRNLAETVFVAVLVAVGCGAWWGELLARAHRLSTS